MSHSPWTQYPNIPWLFYTPCGCSNGGFYIYDTRTSQQFRASDMNGVHQYAADHSGSDSPLRLGDAVHSVTKSLGMRRCGSCARRQSWLNRLFT